MVTFHTPQKTCIFLHILHLDEVDWSPVICALWRMEGVIGDQQCFAIGRDSHTAIHKGILYIYTISS